MYYTPYSMAVTKQICEATKQTDVYTRSSMRWHNYYVARMSSCPVVLTENGYMSNEFDLANTIDKTAIAKKAAAIAQGTANYFLQINQ
jgi:N-acetylmuramoyl-L-alanine amidase